MDGKERSKLSGLAQSIQPIFQIGKNGVTDVVIKELNDALEARELIKITVLKNSGLDTREVMAELCSALSAEPISAVGFKIVIFRKNKKSHF